MSTPQNGQTHSNNASDVADEFFEGDYFVVLALKGLVCMTVPSTKVHLKKVHFRGAHLK